MTYNMCERREECTQMGVKMYEASQVAQSEQVMLESRQYNHLFQLLA